LDRRPGSPIARAEFVPPEPGRLPKDLDNWENYYHADQPDLLVQLAVIHGQFEIIHPFIDGNGRLGRILIPLFLFERKVLSRPVFYLSAYIEQHKDEYIECLRGLGRAAGGWNRWVEFFLGAVIDQAEVNQATARGIKELYERLKVEVIKLTNSRFAVPLLDALFERPII
jgi:Fic family protein